MPRYVQHRKPVRRLSPVVGFRAFFVLLLLGTVACSAGGGGKRGTGSGSGGASAGGAPGGGSGGILGVGGTTVIGQGGAGGSCSGASCGPAVCGDGKIGEGEECEDGNAVSSDGCTDCKVDPGYACPAVGLRCIAKECGDGLIIGTEKCDDNNKNNSDGCSSACRLEPGFACTTTAPTVCHKTTCGDKNQEGFEQCDDGNRVPYDGCSPTCTVEPKCTGGTCTAVCGDGLVFPQEACDDGNTSAGDGCDGSCALESGFSCQTVTLAPPSTLTIPILYRDMLYAGTTNPPGPGHPDFESFGGSGPTTGLVQPTLDSLGKPISSGAGFGVHLTSAESFFWWYHDQDCSVSPCTANQYEKLVYLDTSGNPTTLTLTQQGTTGVYQFSSNAFFPVDGLGWGGQGFSFPGLPPPNNFSFTSELRYQFTYAGGEVLNFTGDDDVWVFINGKLAVDLGGLHPPASGSITLDATAATNLSLTVGGMYEIALFQAERHTNGSNYALSLSGFVHAITECASLCGDGVVAGTEVCDDGKNDGSYGGCAQDCMGRGPYCGDGKVDTAFGEDCDGTGDCTPACLFEIVR